jgi:hypothetical protein
VYHLSSWKYHGLSFSIISHRSEGKGLDARFKKVLLYCSVAVLLFEPQHCSTAQLQHKMKLAS